jgi:hypothetical protein
VVVYDPAEPEPPPEPYPRFSIVNWDGPYSFWRPLVVPDPPVDEECPFIADGDRADPG